MSVVLNNCGYYKLLADLGKLSHYIILKPVLP